MAGGCFWCSEAIFRQLKGVSEAVPGYAGGHRPSPGLANDAESPTYEKVSAGTTVYAEAVQITFDPQVVTYEKILEVFFSTHDPTTPNRQGNDIGPQYRSVIFYHSQEQKKIAENLKQKLEELKVYESPVVTQIAPLTNFYPAEDYHQNYYEKNPANQYCRMVINPKLAKLREHFLPLLKL